MFWYEVYLYSILFDNIKNFTKAHLFLKMVLDQVTPTQSIFRGGGSRSSHLQKWIYRGSLFWKIVLEVILDRTASTKKIEMALLQYAVVSTKHFSNPNF